METTQTIRYELYTKLPTFLVNKAEQANPIIEVITPHKGAVIVEIKRVDSGIFRRATEVSKETQDVINELRTLEWEAKNYLLGEWLKTSMIPSPLSTSK